MISLYMCCPIPSIYLSIALPCSLLSLPSIYLSIYCPALFRLSDLFEKYFIDWIAATDRPNDPDIIAPMETDE